MKTLTNQQISIQVSSHGAELYSIRCNEKEYLWQADPAYWKRHSPVLFPIVGSVWDGEYRHDGKTYKMGQHGFARDMDFELISETSDELRYRLTDSEETLIKYPFHFSLEIGYRIEGKRINVMWTVKNSGDDTMHFQIGAHPAFLFPGYDAASVERGFFGFDRSEGLSNILITEKGCADPTVSYPLALDADGMLPIDIHTFDRDALIMENSQVGRVTLYDKHRQPCLSLCFDTPLVGLWSPPGKNAPFVCIEPWYGRCDRAHYAGEYQDRDWMQHLAPGETFNGGYVIEIH